MDLDEEEVRKRMELMEQEEEEESEEEEGAGGDDEGLVAPKGLDQEADAEEASKKTKSTDGKENAKEDSGGDESD